ncbi:hypothetical protein [Ferrimicrobium sp.]|nr:hypothetical protein [Ferrimicrobium sp.]
MSYGIYEKGHSTYVREAREILLDILIADWQLSAAFYYQSLPVNRRG